IDNDIYSTVDACPNACEMWKAIERMVNHWNRITQEWQRFVTLIKQSQELKTVSYCKLYDILKQHQHEVNEIRAEKIASNSSTRSQQATTRNKGKPIVNSPQPIYDKEPSMVDEVDESLKDNEIDKLMALISLSSAGYENQRNGNVAGTRETVGSSVVQKSGIQCYNCKEFRHIAKECQKPKRAKDTAYYREKMLLCKKEEARIQLNVSKAGHYNVFAMENVHPEQPKYVHDTYSIEQDAQNVIINSLDMTYDKEEFDQNEDDNDLDKERELLASLIEKLKCEIDESKNRNKFLETSNKALIEKLKGEIEDFKIKKQCLESSNNFFKEANNRLSETNNLLYADYKKSESKL
nr:hypothetical protein [Tanacetum cinerariifolium]